MKEGDVIEGDRLSYSLINSLDVLVVGAGPIGLVSAIWFGKRGYRVILIEKYGKDKFNRRHQQVGLNPDSLIFLKNLDIVIWGEVNKLGSVDGDWINIPIYQLQNILYREINNYKNVTVLFETVIDSVTCTDPRHNCRILVAMSDKLIYGLSPRFVVVADGKKDSRSTADRYFGFSPPCKVHLSAYGIIGLIEREIDDNRMSIRIKNYSGDNHQSEIKPELGDMFVRLLGSMAERYIALGNIGSREAFLALTSTEIKQMLLEAYNKYRDRDMGELEITDFQDVSKTPISINLDYRKETIKIFEGSSTICSVEGDAGRSTSFFSGSSLNTGYKALAKTFEFCRDNDEIIFKNYGQPDCFFALDQNLLKKDQECINISYNLLVKGLYYVGDKKRLDSNKCLDTATIVPVDIKRNTILEKAYSTNTLFKPIEPNNIITPVEPNIQLKQIETTTANKKESMIINIRKKSIVNLETVDKNDEPVIYGIYPIQVETGAFVYINGENLGGSVGSSRSMSPNNSSSALINDLGRDRKISCLLESGGTVVRTKDIVLFDNSKIGVKIPKEIVGGKVGVSIQIGDEIVVTSPVDLEVITIVKAPKIKMVHVENDWIYIEGDNFKFPAHVTITNDTEENKIKAYCDSVNLIIISIPDKWVTRPLSGAMTFVVSTEKGSSRAFVKNFDHKY